MGYTHCGHAIVPAILPVSYTGSIRDEFPLTIPEGGQPPRHCKECRWMAIRAKLRYALNSECVICAQRARVGVTLENPTEHDGHRKQHVNYEIRNMLGEIMTLAQPDFITRETRSSAQKAMEEKDRQNVHTALLNAMVLTELEDTVWYRTATKQLAKEQARRHAAGVRAIEYLPPRLAHAVWGEMPADVVGLVWGNKL